MTDEERRTIEHALGLTRRGRHRPRWSSRNNYFTASDDPLMAGMVARGWFAQGARSFGDLGARYFHVTRAGAAAAGLSAHFRREDMLKDER